MDSSWYTAHQLVHYTRTPTALASILRNGFVLIPNKRGLIARLLNTGGFEQREPQQFGMVCFTELAIDQTTKHREVFGSFGVIVSWKWALANKAQRVIYLGDGHIFDTFSWLFRYARQEFEAASADTIGEAHLCNKVTAGLLGGPLFAQLLSLYEFMEDERNSSQVEWRIVNPLPQYYDLTDIDALKRQLIALAQNGVGTMRITPEDVLGIVCPRTDSDEVRRLIPTEYGETPIYTYNTLSAIRQTIEQAIHMIAVRLTADRPGNAIKRQPTRTLSLPRAGPYTNVHELTVEHVNSVLVNPDPLLEAAQFKVQVSRPDGKEVDVVMPFVEGVRVAHLLAEHLRDPTLNHLLNLAIRCLR